MKWQLIKSAPRDGRTVLVTDGSRFAAATPWLCTEPDRIGLEGRPVFSTATQVNPKAGQVEKLWSTIGCSAYTNDAELLDECLNVWQILRPTHWMSLPEPPVSE